MKCCKGAEPYTFRGKINISGCGAVGSARGSGLRGRQFESGHPDHKIIPTKLAERPKG